jgi:choice-of-anchor C domain-containing protein
MNRKAYVGVALTGAIVAAIGFFLPWYVEAFAPPGGYVIVNGIRVNADSYTANGLTVSYAHAYDAGPILRATIFSLFILALITFLQVYPFRGSTLLTSIIRHIVQAKFTYITLKVAKVLLLILESIGWLSFIFLFVVLGQVGLPQQLANQLGGGANAVQVSHYLTIKFGVGYWLMGIGIVISIISLFIRYVPNSIYDAQTRSPSAGCINVVVACVMTGVVIFACIVHPFYSPPQSGQAAGNTSTNTGIVKDGDFEQPALNSSPYRAYSAGQTFGNWTVESGGVTLVGTFWVAAQGVQSVVFSSAATDVVGAIYQDLSTKTGTSYTLSFALAGNPQCTPTVKQMQVWWGSKLVATVSFDTKQYSISKMGWKSLTYKVQATSTKTRLRFAGLTICAPALDNVAVN